MLFKANQIFPQYIAINLKELIATNKAARNKFDALDAFHDRVSACIKNLNS